MAFTPSDDDVQTIVRGLVAAGSIADTDAAKRFFETNVIDAYDDFPAPSGLYATVRRVDPAIEQGSIERLYNDNGGDALEAESLLQVSGSWSLQWYGGRGSGAPSAFDAARRFRLWVQSPGGLDCLQLANFQFLRCSPERDLSTVVSDSTWESRAGLDLSLAYVLRLTESVGVIETIPFGLSGRVDRLLKGNIVISGAEVSFTRRHCLRARLTLPAPSIAATLSHVAAAEPDIVDM